jgi:hypothetical protein
MAPRAGTSALRRTAALTLLLAAACHHDEPRGSDAFTWTQPVAPGAWVRVRNLNGSIRVARASGPQVRISATKRYKGGRPEAVRFVTANTPSGVVVCAVWGGSGGRCTEREYTSGRRNASWLQQLFLRRAGVSVDFVVALPAGVRLDVSNVNGRVTVAEAAGEVRAKTVNGSVTIDARGGPVRAETVNGSVLARVADLAPGAGVSLESVNGSVTALVPPTFDGDVDLHTTNGRVVASVPVAGRQSDRRTLRGTLGAGGRRLSLQTVNGSVRLEPATGAAAVGGT